MKKMLLSIVFPAILLLRAASASDAGAADLITVAAELQRVSSMLAEQEKALASLRGIVAVQQATIDRLQGSSAGATSGTLLAATLPTAFSVTRPAQTPAPQVVAPKKEAPAPPRWFEKYSFRGYSQFRYNRLFETNSRVVCEQCDRSIGNNNGFFIRRARFILFGDINEHLYMYFQPDFASAAGGLNFGQVRDLYFDVAFDKKKEFRVRLGQSKIPYGFENLQSSQNRLTLDRADPTNSSHANERDIGAFFYYAPQKIRRRFSDLVNTGLKGSGDYGVIGFGTYNGQVANRPEGNNSLHYVTRVSYPFQLKGGRFVETGVAAYTGNYAVTSDQRGAGVRGLENFSDRRILGSLTIYPQPLGFQAEYNIGKGPQYTPRNNTIEARGLHGGYAQVMYMKKYEGQTFTPFVKYQYYRGGKKQEFDARSYLVRDLDFGLEWQKNAFFEVVAQYSRADRTFEDSRAPNNRQKGNLLRLQVQINY